MYSSPNYSSIVPNLGYRIGKKRTKGQSDCPNPLLILPKEWYQKILDGLDV